MNVNHWGTDSWRAWEASPTGRAALVSYLAEKQASGMSYDDAWSLAKKERSALFEQMVRK